MNNFDVTIKTIKNDKCCICWESYESNAIMTKCNHHMHEHCFSSMVELSTTSIIKCPMCRTQIKRLVPINTTPSLSDNENILDYNTINVVDSINFFNQPRHNSRQVSFSRRNEYSMWTTSNSVYGSFYHSST